MQKNPEACSLSCMTSHIVEHLVLHAHSPSPVPQAAIAEIDNANWLIGQVMEWASNQQQQMWTSMAQQVTQMGDHQAASLERMQTNYNAGLDSVLANPRDQLCTIKRYSFLFFA